MRHLIGGIRWDGVAILALLFIVFLNQLVERRSLLSAREIAIVAVMPPALHRLYASTNDSVMTRRLPRCLERKQYLHVGTITNRFRTNRQAA
jgi:hypothetical protein